MAKPMLPFFHPSSPPPQPHKNPSKILFSPFPTSKTPKQKSTQRNSANSALPWPGPKDRNTSKASLHPTHSQRPCTPQVAPSRPDSTRSSLGFKQPTPFWGKSYATLPIVKREKTTSSQVFGPKVVEVDFHMFHPTGCIHHILEATYPRAKCQHLAPQCVRSTQCFHSPRSTKQPTNDEMVRFKISSINHKKLRLQP